MSHCQLFDCIYLYPENRSLLQSSSLQQISNISNSIINSNSPVHKTKTSYDKAKSIPGIRALFQDKYVDKEAVTVLSIGDTLEDMLVKSEGASGRNTSVELCGGRYVGVRHLSENSVTLEW